MKEGFLNEYIIQPVFFGFGLITFILVCFKTKSNLKVENLIKSSISIIKYSGIAFFLLWIYSLLNDKSLLERLNGDYWYSVVILMFTYPILSQLFWIKKITNSNLLVGIISLLFLFINLEFSGKIICFDGDCDMKFYFIGILKEVGIYLLILLLVNKLLNDEK